MILIDSFEMLKYFYIALQTKVIYIYIQILRRFWEKLQFLCYHAEQASLKLLLGYVAPIISNDKKFAEMFCFKIAIFGHNIQPQSIWTKVKQGKEKPVKAQRNPNIQQRTVWNIQYKYI